MRNTLIFAGSSCPDLTTHICSNLGMTPAGVELSQFANGETSVKILASVRDKDVFIVQSGSKKINDSIMELLIMISACKGGSANKITAVLPYFPYSRQSKKKSHRGAITARMLANQLHVAGINHVITIDLHASQMQGFFKCPVDNLHAEPIIARWVRHNVRDWKEAVCVSKNPGGTKRVTSLADALKLNFGMVTTDRRRGGDMSASVNTDRLESVAIVAGEQPRTSGTLGHAEANGIANAETNEVNGDSHPRNLHARPPGSVPTVSDPRRSPLSNGTNGSFSAIGEPDQVYTDERAREVIRGRLVHGHIVSDDYPSPDISAMSQSVILDEIDPMTISRASSYFAAEHHALGGTGDAAGSDDEDDPIIAKEPDMERMVTLVGDVRKRTVLLIDDMIDKAGSWIAAAETVVKRGGAKKVYCIATHGLFGGNALQELEDCDCVDHIIVTNSFPLSAEKARRTKKLVIMDLSNLLSEAIRRNHYGESISALFQHVTD